MTALLLAAFERVLADLDVGWEEWGAEIFAIEESFRSDSADRVVPLDFSKTSALAESTVFDPFEGRVEVDFLEVDTLREGSSGDGL